MDHFAVSRVVLLQLGVWHGPQHRVLHCSATQNFFNRTHTVAVVLHRNLQHSNFRVVTADIGVSVFVVVPTSADVNQMDGQMEGADEGFGPVDVTTTKSVIEYLDIKRGAQELLVQATGHSFSGDRWMVIHRVLKSVFGPKHCMEIAMDTLRDQAFVLCNYEYQVDALQGHVFGCDNDTVIFRRVNNLNLLPNEVDNATLARVEFIM
ncbi:hypothetical protein ACP4OV_030189 [Aristida adscensionis]